ncbi:hypothetical protein GCM10009872_12520 [Actinopolymorpha rutila]
MQQFSWQDALTEISKASVQQRTWQGDQTFVGTVYPLAEEDHLLLHRVKSVSEWLSVMDFGTGDWRELESRAHEGYLETSVFCFVPYGNVVGVMQGSRSAPTHKSLEGWLNHLRVFPEEIVVRPLLSRAQIEKLRTAQGANKVEIRIGSDRVGMLRNKQGRLSQFLHQAQESYGDISVTMVISIPRGKARDEDREKLLSDLRDLEDVMPRAADVAKARLVYAESQGPEYSQLVEFVEHHITAKRRVPAVDEEGNSVRLQSAVRVILDVTVTHEEELRLASGVEN